MLPPERIFAVFDPSNVRARAWVEAIGSDFVELDSTIAYFIPEGPFFLLKKSSLPLPKLLSLCRAASRWSGGTLSEAGAFFEATMGDGILVEGKLIQICPTPEIGRMMLADRGSG